MGVPMKLFRLFMILLFFGAMASAQKNDQKNDQQRSRQPTQLCMPGMRMPGCEGAGLMVMQPQNLLQAIVRHTTSGTSMEPISTPAPMLMTRKGRWMLMFHANVFVLDQQQSSVRGADRFFSTNWFMPMAQRKLGPGVFSSRVMVSLEP